MVFKLQSDPLKGQRLPSGQVVTPTFSKNHTALALCSPDHMQKFENDWVNSLGGVELQRVRARIIIIRIIRIPVKTMYLARIAKYNDIERVYVVLI